MPPGKVILPGNKRPCDPLPRKFTDKPEYIGLERFVRVEEAKKFTENIKKLPDISRKRVKNLRSSLKGNHIYDNGDYPACRITQEQRGYTFNTRTRKMDKCPLKELPEKMKYCNGTYNGQVKGWNLCLEEIMNR